MSLTCLLTQQDGHAWCHLHATPAPARPRGRHTQAWLCPKAPQLPPWHHPGHAAVVIA